MRRIYLDHNATTPVDPRVLDAMLPFLREDFGNPSSLHWFGQRARGAVEEARARVAELVAADPGEIVFTSGGSESDNAALRGVAAKAKAPRTGIVCTAIEHHAVLNAAKALGDQGRPVAIVRVGESGAVDPEDLAAGVDQTTALVSVMLANNETGVLQPVAEAARLARARGALVHCDAVQGAGKVVVDVRALDVDLLTLSAHKIYGPKGVGCLYVRRGTPLAAFVRGGGQERNRRAGTENVAGVVGFGTAAALARDSQRADAVRVAALRDRLEAHLLAIPGTRRNGEGPRVPNTTNVSFEGIEAEGLLIALDLEGIAVSTGAACAAGGVEPSHVLRAMGLSPERVQSSLRLSLGRMTSESDVDHAADVIAAVVARQRKPTAP
jgi:cysteine desulfurase